MKQTNKQTGKAEQRTVESTGQSTPQRHEASKPHSLAVAARGAINVGIIIYVTTQFSREDDEARSVYNQLGHNAPEPSLSQY